MSNRGTNTERTLRVRLETVQTLDLRSKRTRGSLLALCDIAEVVGRRAPAAGFTKEDETELTDAFGRLRDFGWSAR